MRRSGRDDFGHADLIERRRSALANLGTFRHQAEQEVAGLGGVIDDSDIDPVSAQRLGGPLDSCPARHAGERLVDRQALDRLVLCDGHVDVLPVSTDERNLALVGLRLDVATTMWRFLSS